MPEILDLAPSLRQGLADVGALLSGDHPRDKAVHGARRGLKRLRALLRLLRAGATDREIALLRTAERSLADLARRLAPARDLRVVAQAAHRLARDHAEKGVRAALTRLARQFETDAAAVEAASAADASGAARAMLAEVGRVLDGLPLLRTPEALAAGAAGTFRRGRRLRAPAFRSGGDEDLHDLRTLVVRHQLQLDVLGGLSGRPWPGRVRRADRLRDLLGEHHDLAVLLQHAADRPVAARTARALAAAATRAQERLTRDAARLARRVYRDRPGAVAAAVRSRLKA